MTITSITQQKNNPQRFSVFIDDEFAFGLEDIDIIQHRLKEGMELSETEYHRILEHSVYEKAKNKAFKYLGYKARTYKEVFDKLSEEDYPEAVVEKVLKLLLGYGYIDDSKYAADYIKQYAKKYGKDRIQFELKRKGITTTIIQEAFEASGINEVDEAVELLKKRFRGFPSEEDEIDEKEKRRSYAYLARRGYAHEKIQQAFREFFI